MAKPRTGEKQKRYRDPSAEPGTTRRSVRIPNYLDRQLIQIAERRGMHYSQVLRCICDQARGSGLPIFME